MVSRLRSHSRRPFLGTSTYMTEQVDEWKCPKCEATNDGCGTKKSCIQREQPCQGLICECEEDTAENHGNAEDPCHNATCYHCGWGGTMPTDTVKCPTCKGSGRIQKAKVKSQEPRQEGK